MTKLVSIVAPFYNEEENVRPTWERVVEAMTPLNEFRFEGVFVDDGSTDGTGRALDELAARDTRLHAVHFVQNRGQSAALIAGMRAAKGEYVLTIDGDLQNDPADFPKFLELLAQYDCVCGVRVNRRDTWVRRVSSRVANRVRNVILRDGIRDSGCGAKGFRRAVVDHLPCFNGVHRFFAVFVRRAGFSIIECDVRHQPRIHGVSKYGIHNRLWRGMYDLFGVAWLRKRYVTYEIADNPPAAKAAPGPASEAPARAAAVVKGL
ncbi:MAG: glycosyltransferase family 2 protein [Candidatus Hydrogenedentota bacterium]